MALFRCQSDIATTWESVNDTYLPAWNSIPPQRPIHFFAFLAEMCRFAAYGKLEWKTAQKRRAEVVELTNELETCIPDSAAQPAFDGRELGELLNIFLGTLNQEKRCIFKRRKKKRWENPLERH